MLAKGVAEGSAPALVTFAGGGAADAVPVAVLTDGAVSVTMIVEFEASSEVVEMAEDTVLEIVEFAAPELVEIDEDMVLEPEVTRRPESQADKVTFQESASVHRSLGSLLGAFVPHCCGVVTFQAAASVHSTSSCQLATMMSLVSATGKKI